MGVENGGVCMLLYILIIIIIIIGQASPTLTSSIEIETPACADIYIYIYVQNNAWHPPEGMCHVLRRRHMRALWYHVARPLT